MVHYLPFADRAASFLFVTGDRSGCLSSDRRFLQIDIKIRRMLAPGRNDHFGLN